MQKGSAGPPGAVNQVFGQVQIIIAVICLFIAGQVDQAAPAPPDTDYLVAFAQGADCNRPDSRVQARNITAPGQNTDNSRFSFIHVLAPFPHFVK